MNRKIKRGIIIPLESCNELAESTITRLSHLSDPNCEIKIVRAKSRRFGNNEINSFPEDSVRGSKVFIIASGSNYKASIDDNIMEIFSMIRACRDASAKHITVIIAYYPYSRSDKKDQARAPIMAKLCCDIIKTAGAHRIISFDLHAGQIQGFFDGPFDNLYAINELIEAIKNDYPNEKFIVVSPDAGGDKRALAWSEKLQTQYTFLTKSRNHGEISIISKHELVHQIDFTNATILLVDDIGDTLGTLCSAAKIIKEKGAKKVLAIVTHGVFSSNAIKNLNDNVIDQMYCTNTLPQNENLTKTSKLKVVDLSKLLCQAILSCIDGESISKLFI